MLRSLGLLVVRVGVIVLGLASTSSAAAQHESQPVGEDRFATVRDLRLHYVDWGGTGPVLLFLTGGGSDAHSFDLIAPQFTDRFRVLGLTRRGQGLSDKPPGGYDIETLSNDIKGFLDTLGIPRASFVAFSIAGDELTRFAGRYGSRVSRLVYLDAAYDRQSNWALNERSPFPRSKLDPIAAAIVDGAREAPPDYSQVRAPALGVFAIPGAVPLRSNMDDAVRLRAEAFWRDFQEWIRGQVEEFRRGVKQASILVLPETTHSSILGDNTTRTRVITAMRRFLAEQ